MESFEDKQPYEAYYIDFDFTNVLSSLDEIATAIVTAVDENNVSSPEIISSIKQNIDSPKVYIWVQAGASGKTYTITCKIVTANGEKYEVEGSIAVIET